MNLYHKFLWKLSEKNPCNKASINTIKATKKISSYIPYKKCLNISKVYQIWLSSASWMFIFLLSDMLLKNPSGIWESVKPNPYGT